ncbi:MAG: response regulator transcription factor [Nitrospiraceae bacterium]|nr:response regulator transcription factor [Nitrospiraceae bacterium]
MERILVIDDDMELCELLKDYLRPEGFEVEAVHDGRQAVERALSEEHALTVLDVMLPGASGFEVLRRIREGGCRIPVLMLTARGDEVDRIVGLEMGADDYLPKPFNPRELVARIRAVKRRAVFTRLAGQFDSRADSGADAGRPLRIAVGDIELDAGARTARLAGKTLELTAVEFNLLEELLQNAGRLVSREGLSNRVLGHGVSPYDRSIDVHISNLRKKLGPGQGGSPRIKTVRGTGYIYALRTETSGE